MRERQRVWGRESAGPGDELHISKEGMLTSLMMTIGQFPGCLSWQTALLIIMVITMNVCLSYTCVRVNIHIFHLQQVQ